MSIRHPFAGPRVTIVAVAALFVACASPEAPESEAPSATLVPAATSSVSAPTASAGVPASQSTIANPSAPAAATLTWAEQEFGGSVDGVVAFGGAYVAVGTIERVPTAWTSADGEDWERHAVPYDPPEGDAPGMPGPWMGNLVEHDGYLYAIGGYQGGGDGISPLGWRSPDGRTWEQIASQSPFYTDGYLVMRLVSGAPGLLALTHGFAAMSGGVWLWTPEGSWAEVTDAFPATSGGAEFYDASWADGQYVVVGHGSGGESGDASVWTSADGRIWRVHDEPYPWESNQDQLGVVTAVAPAPGGGWSAFLMAPGRAVGLYSTDARSWEVSQDLTRKQSGHIWSLASVGDRLIAAGGGEGQESWVLASGDGRSWEESFRTSAAQAPAFEPRGGPTIASNGSSIVVFLSLLEPESSRRSVLLRAPLG